MSELSHTPYGEPEDPAQAKFDELMQELWLQTEDDYWTVEAINDMVKEWKHKREDEEYERTHILSR